MALQDHFTDEERERQAAITASWEAARNTSPEVLQRIQDALARLPEYEDLTPRQQLQRKAMVSSMLSARETARDPELMAWLAAVVERLEDQPPAVTEPAALWDAPLG